MKFTSKFSKSNLSKTTSSHSSISRSGDKSENELSSTAQSSDLYLKRILSRKIMDLHRCVGRLIVKKGSEDDIECDTTQSSNFQFTAVLPWHLPSRYQLTAFPLWNDHSTEVPLTLQKYFMLRVRLLRRSKQLFTGRHVFKNSSLSRERKKSEEKPLQTTTLEDSEAFSALPLQIQSFARNAQLLLDTILLIFGEWSRQDSF